ncbi:hypothetical protein [Mesorhizobium sp.]|uniref:hypothetical protein n=1 Tax=Mesorhizobium sp. TaxID=1871066 RepID=UPI0025BC415B|nr:hypothetical protein [Mesorhizobium sp.]
MIREARNALHRPTVLQPGEQAGGSSGDRDAQGFDCRYGPACRCRFQSIKGIQISVNVTHSYIPFRFCVVIDGEGLERGAFVAARLRCSSLDDNRIFVQNM